MAGGRALVRAPGATLADGIVTHIDREPVDLALARAQHEGYVAALASRGWEPVAVAPSDDHPDAVFIEDQVVVVDDVAVLTHSGAPQRRGERPAVEVAVHTLGLRVVALEAPATLDGGDVLQVGTTVYVGRGGRTNDEGIAGLRAAVEPLGRDVVPVPLKRVLHLKSALTALPDGRLLGVPDLIDAEDLPPILTPPEEAGSHVVPIGGNAVLLAASAPATAALLQGEGFDVVAVNITEFEKLEGCVTCLSVLIPRN